MNTDSIQALQRPCTSADGTGATARRAIRRWLGKHRAPISALAVGLAAFATAPAALAQMASFQFSQVFPDGGQVDGFVIGEDTDGDGRLYSMASFIGDFLGLPVGDEVAYVSLHFRNFEGRSFTQVYDRSETGIEDPDNAFFAFAYNLDGGAFGDDPDEGMFLGPLAPSTSYIMGPLITPASAARPDEGFGPCGGELPCATVTSLLPVDPFPNFEITFNAYSTAAVATTTRLRFEFRQGGFADGGAVRGVLVGTDLDGDGRLYTATPLVSGFFGYPLGDEVEFIRVEFTDFEGSSFTYDVDRSVNALADQEIAFTAVAYNLDGRYWGDEADEGVFSGPLAPSTSYNMGRLIPPESSFEDAEFDVCGSDQGVPCAAVVRLDPDGAPPGFILRYADVSADQVEMVPAPLVADGEFIGSWYPQGEEGQGYVVEALADGRVVVYWYTYDEDGNQRWFIGIARREGMSLIVDELLLTQGGLFGPMFNPDDVQKIVAGSLRIDFDGCNSGVARYVVDGVEGTHNILRLTLMAGISCRDTQGPLLR